MIYIKRIIFIIGIIVLTSTHCIASEDYTSLIHIIKGCADFSTCSGNDENSITLNLLRYHQNFSSLSQYPPQSGSAGKLGFCGSRHITDIAKKLFGITPPIPSPASFTTLGYYCNDGYYYFSLPEKSEKHTEFNNVLDFIPLPNSHIYAVFTTFESGNPKTLEYNGIEFSQSKTGLPIVKVDKNINLDDISSQLTKNSVFTLENAAKYIPPIVVLTAAILICIVIYVFFLR